MKLPYVSRLVLLVVLSSCSMRIFLAAQTGARTSNPPEKLRFCVKGTVGDGEDCETDTWAGDHYNVDGSKDELDRLTITQWSGGKVVVRRNFRFVTGYLSTHDRKTSASFDCSGRIAASGDHTERGPIVGNLNAGTCTLSWDPRSSSSAIGKVVAEQERSAALAADEDERIKNAFSSPPHRVNGILVPAGASDVFATFPADVRAILLPEHDLTIDPMRPCDDSKEDDPENTGVKDPIQALEIGKFALRRGEYLRGRCWINHSGILNYNPRAVTIFGILYMMGWAADKNPVYAYKYFNSVAYQTHDVWAFYFLEQCYMWGYGTDKDLARAAGIDTYLMTHDDGQEMYLKIGADDENVVKRANAIRDAMNPRTKTVTRCYQLGPNSTVPGAPKNQRCENVEVPADGNN